MRSRLSRLSLTAAAATALLLASPHGARTADMAIVTPAPAGRPSSPPDAPARPTLRLTGVIEKGDADRLRNLLSRVRDGSSPVTNGPFVTVELSSMGGSLSEGIGIGELLRREKAVAVVRRRDLCLSACALALLGGNARRDQPDYPADCNVEIGGKVAFHNFFLNRNGLREITEQDPVASRLQGFADARGGAAMLVKYASDMGLPPSFVTGVIGRPVEDFQYVETVGQFLELNICPIGLGRPSQPIERQAINVCRNALDTSAPPADFEAASIPQRQAKQFLLQRVQENMQSAKARGRLADQLASWSVMRVQEEIDRLYEDLRAAGLALPEIVGPTFEIGIRQDGRHRVACYVSLSASEPDRFEVVVQGNRGLAEAPRQPPENARRLFRLDPGDIINPRPGGLTARPCRRASPVRRPDGGIGRRRGSAPRRGRARGRAGS
jgi:hypothetical protein